MQIENHFGAFCLGDNDIRSHTLPSKTCKSELAKVGILTHWSRGEPDAVLGAAGLGDIGRHFPDTDPQFKGADSVVLLVEAVARARAAGWQLGNIDCTIVAQAPKMAPHIPLMREKIAQAVGLAPDAVNVKAKTAEKMGPVGEGKAIEARAVCLLQKQG